VIIQHSRWLAKLGAIGYDALIRLNRILNYFAHKLGKPNVSLSKRIKDNVKLALKYIGDFEKTAAQAAISRKFDYILCGHIHKPQKCLISNGPGQVLYLNSGDWIENLSALEYYEKEWSVYLYKDDPRMELDNPSDTLMPDQSDLEEKELFRRFLNEITMQI
jgi:UDP-2,3-diacylglucosamine pyrophosphatase LpxH